MSNVTPDFVGREFEQLSEWLATDADVTIDDLRIDLRCDANAHRRFQVRMGLDVVRLRVRRELLGQAPAKDLLVTLRAIGGLWRQVDNTTAPPSWFGDPLTHEIFMLAEAVGERMQLGEGQLIAELLQS